MDVALLLTWSPIRFCLGEILSRHGSDFSFRNMELAAANHRDSCYGQVSAPIGLQICLHYQKAALQGNFPGLIFIMIGKGLMMIIQ